MMKLLFTLGVITLGLAVGCSIQRLVAPKRLILWLPIVDMRRLLQKVGLILSSAPVAFTALIPPSIYALDLDLSNACWLTSALALSGVLPIMYVLIQHL
jgi:hypothetical protein